MTPETPSSPASPTRTPATSRPRKTCRSRRPWPRPPALGGRVGLSRRAGGGRTRRPRASSRWQTAGRSPRSAARGGWRAGRARAARVAALAGMRVALLERADQLGGMVVTASRAPGRPGWERSSPGRKRNAALPASRSSPVTRWPSRSSTPMTARRVLHRLAPAGGGSTWPRSRRCWHCRPVVRRTIGRRGAAVAGRRLRPDRRPYRRRGGRAALASLGAHVTFVTPDFVVGEQLARTGDLAPPACASSKPASCSPSGAWSVPSTARASSSSIADSGVVSTLPVAVFVDAGHRLPEDTLYRAVSARPQAYSWPVTPSHRGPSLEAVLEGRRVAMRLSARPPRACSPAQSTMTSSQRYPLLFSPLRIGPVTVANRAVFSAHLTNYARGRPAERPARRLLRRPGRRRRRAHHHRGALDSPDGLAVREAHPRLSTRPLSPATG